MNEARKCKAGRKVEDLFRREYRYTLAGRVYCCDGMFSTVTAHGGRARNPAFFQCAALQYLTVAKGLFSPLENTQVKTALTPNFDSCIVPRFPWFRGIVPHPCESDCTVWRNRGVTVVIVSSRAEARAFAFSRSKTQEVEYPHFSLSKEPASTTSGWTRAC